jgi:magnesium transporter
MLRSIYRSHDGTVSNSLTPEQLRIAFEDQQGTLWLDVIPEAADREQIAALFRHLFAFHPLALDAALQESHIPRVDDWEKYLYIVLHAADCPSDGTLRTHELDLFLGPNYLVTIHEEPIPPLDHLWDQCRQGAGQRLQGGADHLLYLLADALTADYMGVVDRLDDEIDRIEAAVFHPRGSRLVSDIFRVRRSLLRLRRILGSLREVMNRLARDDFPVIDAKDRVYFRDVYDHMVRLYEIVDGLRDMIGGALDSYLSVTSNRMNEVMRTLTVVTVLFLPLNYLAGFFGMNFFGEPFNVLNPFPSTMLFGLCLAAMVGIPLGMWQWMVRRGMMRPAGTEERQADE